MKIRTKLTISIAFFGIVMLIVSTWVLITYQQITELRKQEKIASAVELEVGELGYLSSDYLLHHESQQINRWRSKYASLSADLSNLSVGRPDQLVILNSIKSNQQSLKQIFDDVVSTIEAAEQTQHVTAIELIQVSWSRIAVQNQSMAFEASRLSTMLHEEAEQLELRRNQLIIILIGSFVAFLFTDLLLIFRRMIKSITKLQAGTRIVGSGNFDYFIEEKYDDEIGELTRAFNRMTKQLKTVTASRNELEKEISERKQAEEAVRQLNDELEQRVAEQTAELQKTNLDLEERIAARTAEIQTAYKNLQASRLAALNLMDDARVAQKQVEQRNAEMEVVLTELKQAQESLRKAYDEMDARVQERTRELAVANRELSNEIAERKLTEQKIELERDKLKSILDTMQDGVYIVNQDYEVEYINPVIEKEFGKVNGRKCYQFFYNHPDICKSCVHEQVLHGNVLSTERTSEITGRVYDLLDMPLRNSDGSVSKLRIIHDITHLKEKEQQLRHYNLELQNISMAEHKQRQFSEALVEAALALNKSTDLEEVLTRILERINAVIPYQLAGIALLEGESFYFANHQGDRSWPDAQIGTQSRFSLDDIPSLNNMRRSGQPVLISDTWQEQDWRIVEGLAWSRSFLSAPLLVEKQVIGFVNLFADQPDFFTQEMCEQLVAFASHAAVAIQNAWLFEQVRASSERLQSLSRRLVEIQESERLYIARELHDEAGQMLTSLVLDLSMLKKKAAQPDLVLKKVAEMEVSLNDVLENLHRIAMALRPASLDHLGLIAALSQYVETVGEKQGIKVNFKSDELRKRLPPNVETVLYRIVQEALTNVVRHARATQVDVVLTRRDQKLIVIVEDDGIGFDPDAVSTCDHLGLFGMRERAEMIAGNLVVESEPGRGTTIMMEVACPA